MSELALPRYAARGPREAAALPPFASRARGLEEARSRMRPIVADVARRGDAALAEWSRRLDGVSPEPLEVSLVVAEDEIAPAAREALALAVSRIRAFHERTAPPARVTADNGLGLERRFEPFDRAGLYVPGGRAAYPSTVLMLAIPARVAGVGRVVATTPPGIGGDVPVVVRYAAALAGVDALYAVGGAQAIAALAYGTETVSAVDVIVGPGNRWVTAAKTLVSDRVATDGPAGPSEIAILADGSTDPDWTAADVLAQLEHDPDARALVLSTATEWLDAVDGALASRIHGLTTAATIRQAVCGSGAVLVPDIDAGAKIASLWAPEHLSVAVAEPDAVRPWIRGAGAVFVGARAPVALGDYLAGPNHTLPTGGAARFESGLGVERFGRWSSWVTEGGSDLVSPLLEAAATLADLEGLPAHAASLRARLPGTMAARPEPMEAG